MIAGIFHQGSGLGNQLHRYVMTRVLAEDKGFEWGMVSPELFKGGSFMHLETGSKINTDWFQLEAKTFHEKKVVDNGVDIRGYDPEVNFIGDNTIIDGEFQDERYFAHRMSDIDLWLKVKPALIPEDTCVIGFRGGEYAIYSDLFLPKEYWESAILRMRSENPAMRFQVHTDDVSIAKQFFPDFECIHDISVNWRSVRYAKNAIIANSSFYILPRLLNGGMTIAPRYWARHNTKVWALPQNYYKRFTYL